jgi:RNAse (barnase) inhibitor barstar
VQVIQLDASAWETPLDFILALKDSLGSPEAHGSSPDAFVDSMIWGGMNQVEPPYLIRIVQTGKVPDQVKNYIRLMASVVQEAREERCSKGKGDIDVTILVPELSN